MPSWLLPSRLYVICDAEACERAGWTLVDFASACLDGGARVLQVRAKRASSRWLFEAVLDVVERVHRAGTDSAIVIVNDRADIARLARADGVHVGQDDLSPRQVRTVLGDTGHVGLSTHTVDQIDAAVRELANDISYLAIGPVFATVTKTTGYDAVGLERVREAAMRTAPRGLPLVGIGGITIERAPAVIEAGAQAVAVISDLLATGDPEARVREFLAALR